MKTIIAGSRTIRDYEAVSEILNNYITSTTEVVCGKAKGVDTIGERWAKANDIPVKYFPADWNKYGKPAGYIRNREMAKYGDRLILIWDGKSKGSKHMKDLARSYSLEVLEFIL